eukprot:238735-Chlamydomonas_euryale.AAC.1
MATFHTEIHRGKSYRHAWQLWMALCAENAVDVTKWPPSEEVWVTFLTVLRGSMTVARFHSTVVGVGTPCRWVSHVWRCTAGKTIVDIGKLSY